MIANPRLPVPARPSKAYFYELFHRDMEQFAGAEVGADIAAATCKNLPCFRTKKYIAVDIDQQRLRQGIEKYRGRDDLPEAVPICADIREVDRHLAPRSVDVVVSTHTLHHLPASDRLPAVRLLTTLVRPGGSLILQMCETTDLTVRDVAAILEPEFSDLRIRRYRNAVSRAYESLIAGKDGQVTYRDDSASVRRWKSAASRGLRLLERCRLLGWTGDHAYIRADRRR